MMFLYGLRDPLQKRIRYIGITTNPYGRLKHHLAPAHLKGELYKNRWILKLKRNNQKPEMVILATFEDKEACARAEIECIAQSSSWLTNTTGGGEGGQLGCKPSQETLIKMRKKRSPEFGAAVSRALSGVKKSPIAINNSVNAKMKNAEARLMASPLIGQCINGQTIVGVTRNKSNQLSYLVRCSCGNERPIQPSHFNGHLCKLCFGREVQNRPEAIQRKKMYRHSEGARLKLRIAWGRRRLRNKYNRDEHAV